MRLHKVFKTIRGYPDLSVHKCERTLQQLSALSQQKELIPPAHLAQVIQELSVAFEDAHVLSEQLSTQQAELQVAKDILTAERQQYFELFNSAPDGYIVTDHHGIIEQINLMAATLLNRRQWLFLGNPLVVLMALADRQRFYAFLNSLQKGATLQNINLCLQPYGGPLLYANFTVTVVRDYQDRIIGFRWLFRDLTSQRQAATTLRAIEQRYDTLAAVVPVGIFCTNAAGLCTYTNKRWCEMAGLSPAAAVGEGWKQGIHPDDLDRVVAAWTQSIQENRSYQLEYRFQSPDGHVTWAYGQTNVEQDAEGQVIGYVGTVTDISDLKQAQELASHNALHDSLTDLPNRTLLLERLELTLNKARRYETYQYAVLFLDLDRFKLINDSLGHMVGDQLLTKMAQNLKTHLRDIDLVSRLGGDEFVILLEDTHDSETVLQIVERILASCQTPFIIGPHEIFITLSMGIVLGTSDYRQASDVIRDADIAMYHAKVQGKNAYQFFDVSMHTKAQTRFTLETELRKALEQEEFTVYYQPVLEVSNNNLVGFEALVRWEHPTRGLISPDDFIPIAEGIGLIGRLDHWVFAHACRQMVCWKTQFLDCFPLTISINLSAQSLRNTHMLQEIDDIMIETGIVGGTVILEITESMLIEDIDQTIELLAQLASRNIKISIDDFGTGYSSLNYLHRLPVHALKIDRSFVSQMAENDNYQVVSTIISLADQLDLTVVAEGIELSQQLKQLQKLGCKLGQGYLFSKPLAAAEIETHFLSTTVANPTQNGV